MLRCAETIMVHLIKPEIKRIKPLLAETKAATRLDKKHSVAIRLRLAE